MTEIKETAYPRIPLNISEEAIKIHFTPTQEDLTFVRKYARSESSRFGLMLLLKLGQYLGYFPNLLEILPRVTQCVAQNIGITNHNEIVAQYEQGKFRGKHIPLVRNYLGLQPFDQQGRQFMKEVLHSAAQSKDIIADLINTALEALSKASYELPAFSTLHRAASTVRTKVNQEYYQQVYAALDEKQRLIVKELLLKEPLEEKSNWQRLKREPKQPNSKSFREFNAHLEWLLSLNITSVIFNDIPDSKIHRFIDEAKAINLTQVKRFPDLKSYTLVALLVANQTAQALDDLAEMFVRRVLSMHNKAKEKLADYRDKHQDETDELIDILHRALNGWCLNEEDTNKLQAIKTVWGGNEAELLAKCEQHLVFAKNNHLPFLPSLFQSRRKSCFDALEILQLKSNNEDKKLEKAIQFMLKYRDSKASSLSTKLKDGCLDLSWMDRRWLKPVTGKTFLDPKITQVNRKSFELCLVSSVMQELKSGDLYAEGGETYGDYNKQLLPLEEYEQYHAEYCRQTGVPSTPEGLVSTVETQLTDMIRDVDASFPDNEEVRIEDGEPVVRVSKSAEKPKLVDEIDRLLRERLPQKSIVDVLTDCEHWLGWTKHFSPVSGLLQRLDQPQQRYITTTLCYGCYLGPTQTARSVGDFDRKQIAYVNHYHVTEQDLIEANNTVINKYNTFTLPRTWGSGKTASVDGTKWDMYERNLLSEYHVRYKGWGGIGYYHISDMYIALFSNFIPCGAWESIYLFDGLYENTSNIHPDTLYTDTQGQSETVFGLAYLLSVELLPRIRGWKHLTFYLPYRSFTTEHIQDIFSDHIDWNLIKDHYHSMMRVVISISKGKIRPSTILRKLGTYSRKNKLYLAFRELGRAVRTIFLLKLIKDKDLRKTVSTATNTAESWNNFVKWLGFGNNGVIPSNNREQQRRYVRYNHLVANLLILHNTDAMTRVLQDLVDEGYHITNDIAAYLSPHRTEHVNRFGRLDLRLDRIPPPLQTNFKPFAF